MLKVMIAGSGGIAPAHIEGFLKFPDTVKITHIVSPSGASGDALNQRYSLGAKVVRDFKDGYLDVDIIAIISPPGTHAPIAIAALDAGKHVLCEKPMAKSLLECDQMLDAQKRGGGIFGVVAQSRFISAIRGVVDIVRGAQFGKTLYTRVNSCWYRGESYYHMGWRGKWTQEGGGCTLNHAVHHIDLMLWAKGMPCEVISVMDNLSHTNSEEEDLSMSILRFPDGSYAELTASLLHHGEPQGLMFQMRDGGICIPFTAYASSARENGFPLDNPDMKRQIEDAYAARTQLAFEHHDGQIENFLNAVTKGEQLISSGVDGRNTIELITAIYKSALTRKPVSLPLKHDCFYDGSWVDSAIHFHEKTISVDRFADSSITSFKDRY